LENDEKFDNFFKLQGLEIGGSTTKIDKGYKIVSYKLGVRK